MSYYKHEEACQQRMAAVSGDCSSCVKRQNKSSLLVWADPDYVCRCCCVLQCMQAGLGTGLEHQEDPTLPSWLPPRVLWPCTEPSAPGFPGNPHPASADPGEPWPARSALTHHIRQHPHCWTFCRNFEACGRGFARACSPCSSALRRAVVHLSHQQHSCFCAEDCRSGQAWVWAFSRNQTES